MAVYEASRSRGGQSQGTNLEGRNEGREGGRTRLAGGRQAGVKGPAAGGGFH
jgi:hypothetical protein